MFKTVEFKTVIAIVLFCGASAYTADKDKSNQTDANYALTGLKDTLQLRSIDCKFTDSNGHVVKYTKLSNPADKDLMKNVSEQILFIKKEFSKAARIPLNPELPPDPNFVYVMLWLSNPQIRNGSNIMTTDCARVFHASGARLERNPECQSYDPFPKINNQGWLWAGVKLRKPADLQKPLAFEIDYVVGDWQTDSNGMILAPREPRFIDKQITVEMVSEKPLVIRLTRPSVHADKQYRIVIQDIDERHQPNQGGQIITAKGHHVIFKEKAVEEYMFDVKKPKFLVYLQTKPVRTARFENISLQPGQSN